MPGEDHTQGFRYILGAKPGDHERLFRWFEASEIKESWKVRDKKTGTVHHYEWDIGLPLNDANFHLKVNMLKYKETNKKGEIKRFSWVTDLPLDRDTVTLIMRAGRRRWAIEKETFKALNTHHSGAKPSMRMTASWFRSRTGSTEYKVVT